MNENTINSNEEENEEKEKGKTTTWNNKCKNRTFFVNRVCKDYSISTQVEFQDGNR